MKSIRLATLFFTFIFPVLALAQGSGHVAPPPPPNAGPAPSNDAPFEVTKSFTGTIVEIQPDTRAMVVEEKDGKRTGFKVDDHTAFKADKKTELEGRKKLKLEDFEKGQPVTVTFRASDNKVLEVRLRHVKN
jgi:hypothetical protein